ncbi:hypothetical protein [Anaerocolumna aminovalerica]|uniref:hypothetical protein n=1 Tax=Anaerocolumna aminovalerica TaxID=1527 RepID=UPI001596AFD0|nr:hypothetical protein [Anaerocolumna aminovalerica]
MGSFITKALYLAQETRSKRGKILKTVFQFELIEEALNQCMTVNQDIYSLVGGF